jgi:hypothetical protein
MLQKATGAVGKTLELPSSEMEIEIAELLYGLMTSKNHDSSSQKVEATINHNTSTEAGEFEFLEIFSLLFVCLYACVLTDLNF